MKTWIAPLALVALVAACGGSEARSGGTLTIPPPDASTTSTSGPSSTTVPDAPGTTNPTTGDTTSPTTTPADETTVTVYFLDESPRAVPVERTAQGPGVARGAVEALIAGPNSSEEAAGLSSAVPGDSLVLGLTIADGTATVDMSLEFESGGGSTSVLGRLAQLVYTLTEFDNVARVALLMEGEAVEYFSGEGVLVDEPLTRADFLDAFPVVTDGPVASAPTWDQDDLDAVQGDGGPVHHVVLVAPDDFLNVREQAGVEGRVMGRLLPDVAVRLTGGTTPVGSSTWREIHTPAGRGWVNDFYLTPSLSATPELAFEEAALDMIADLSERFAAGAEFTELVSERGLWVSHHAPPIRFDPNELAGILDDPTTYRWGSNALEPGSPEIQPRTFSQAVADRFVDAYDDPDRRVLVGKAVEGPNGRPPQFALPTEFSGFPFVTVFDPGDEARYDGLDWITWGVSFSYEEDGLKVVGLTLDEWAP